ncbi:MAG: DUF2807 domain-containing protein [Microscillaceae bacterium]|nr:DUF2807 domain-containing protein [Microscillaceae bacterium]MDW8460130.1 DUF2807 domain-containing protein [Cytophagales bacterium]
MYSNLTTEPNEIKLSRAASLKAEHKIEVANFELRVSGASCVSLNLEALKIDVEASGASDIKVTGKNQGASCRSQWSK